MLVGVRVTVGVALFVGVGDGPKVGVAVGVADGPIVGVALGMGVLVGVGCVPSGSMPQINALLSYNVMCVTFIGSVPGVVGNSL